ncbi:hypothetical protein ACFOD4_13880 [Pseudoroseomonas globiformis]|uniref:Uncharacterized protein n=1 Tax=Teichococcus globiformis TaxID=2307229 RepID=A0ABV7G0G8_9PROT
MSGPEIPQLRRPRRRRALASAWRHAMAQEGGIDTVALEARLRAVAESHGTVLPPEADLPEIMARLPHGGGLPPEWLALLATLLLPLLSPDTAPRSVPR